jgi:hypothetical protein
MVLREARWEYPSAIEAKVEIGRGKDMIMDGI